MHSVDIIAIVVVGLLSGTELTVSLFINPTMWRLDGAAQGHALSLFAVRLGRVMPFWYAAGLVLLIVETVARRGGPEFGSLLAATLVWAATVVFSVALLVPINKRIADLAAHAPIEDWLPSHKRWDKLHRLRIAMLVAALILLAHALLAVP